MTELRNARYLSVHDRRRRINEGDVDTVLVAFTDLQGRLQGERVHATYFAEHVLDQGIAAPGYLLAVDLDMSMADPDGLVAEQADQEMTLVLDLQTIRLLQHQAGAVLVQCDVVGLDRTPVVQSPRAILTQQLEVAASRGYHVLASTELEFMIFNNSYEDAQTAQYRDLAAASPVPRGLLDRCRQPDRTGTADDPQHRLRRWDRCSHDQAEAAPGATRHQFRLSRRLDDRRRSCGLQDHGQGDRRPARQIHHLHGQLRRTAGKRLSRTPIAAV